MFFVLEWGSLTGASFFFEENMVKVKKFFISAFIVFNFLIMARVHLPLDVKFFSSLYVPVDTYTRFFSTFQDWMMFAPNPSRTNYELSAEIEFTDGSRDSWFFPKASELSIVGKYLYGERYRKFISEGVRKNENNFMWKDTARFALRKIGENHYNKIPSKVHLYRHWEDVPLLSDGMRTHGTRPDKLSKFRFFTHEVM